jgi:hypothetical protein
LGQIDQSASDDSGDNDVDDSSHPGKPRQRNSTEKTKAVKRVVSFLVTVPSILPEVNVLNVISSGYGYSRGHPPAPSTSRSSNGARGYRTGASSEPPHLGTPRPGEHTTTSGVTALKGVTVTCLRLLLGEMGESGLVEHAPSRILSAVIAAVYVSLVVETAHSGFFRALRGMRGPLRSSDRHEEGHEKEVRGISESTCSQADATVKTGDGSSGNYGSGEANVAMKRKRQSSKAAINRRKGFRDLRDRHSNVT